MNELAELEHTMNQLCKDLTVDNLVLNRLNNEVDKITAHRDAWQKRIDRMQKQFNELKERRTYLELNA